MASNAEVAAFLLRNCAEFFQNIGQQNSELQDQMSSNAEACAMAAQLVEEDPLGDSPVRIESASQE